MVKNMSKAEKKSMDYYEFLDIIRNVSDNVSSIQANSVNIVITNYDLTSIKEQMNKELSQLNLYLSQ